jgi:hypothetical protein
MQIHEKRAHAASFSHPRIDFELLMYLINRVLGLCGSQLSLSDAVDGSSSIA